MSSEEKRESVDVAPSMNPEERPNLQDYKDKGFRLIKSPY